eukprot:TRINITY_DN78_c0_g1_i1.p1 TRINITY_DN78_c0_g1~~TRINITY_DN78_c0_g1_i1.p1  ORF type:complete len:333 (-),score=92.52 TRINITY_DN78_c0_g1_i1:86-1084(-)
MMLSNQTIVRVLVGVIIIVLLQYVISGGGAQRSKDEVSGPQRGQDSSFQQEMAALQDELKSALQRERAANDKVVSLEEDLRQAEKDKIEAQEAAEAAGDNQGSSMTPKYCEGHLKIDQMYDSYVSTASDINEHLPTLYKYGKNSQTIGEFGVRSVVSTWAWLRALRDAPGNKKTYIAGDLNRSPNIDPALSAAKAASIEMEFIQGNDLDVDLKSKVGGVDVLFIDTLHVYPLLIRELRAHSPNVRKYILMHDTTIDGPDGEIVRTGYSETDVEGFSKATGFSKEDLRQGLTKAINEFLEEDDEWVLHKRYTNNNGLTILRRKTHDANEEEGN